MLNLPPPLTQ
uniref:Uncharacterized protein n=1 Tax=Arundo donax TaxID=35708 RepID=A0A0A9B7Q1_ARUDO